MLSDLRYRVQNGKMAVNYELEKMWTEAVWPSLRFYLSICVEGLRETTKTSQQ
jgi:hypothetical protein